MRDPKMAHILVLIVALCELRNVLLCTKILRWTVLKLWGFLDFNFD